MQFYVICVKRGSTLNVTIDYKYLQGCKEPWYCLSCTTVLFPFGNLDNQKFLGFVKNNNDNNND